MTYFAELKEWDAFISRVLGDGVQLISVSAFSSDCRVYRRSDSVFKVRRLTPAATRGRVSSLEDEFLILQRLEGIDAVPRAKSYQRDGAWEVLEMEA